MSWTSEGDIAKQVERLWKRGDILRSLLPGSAIFPLRLRLSIPSPRDMAMDLKRAQEWIAMLSSLKGVRVEWCDSHTRALGTQRLPESAWLDSPSGALEHLQLQVEAESFLDLYSETGRFLPELLPWVRNNPMRALSFKHVWVQLLQVAAWKKSFPNLEPVYVRQIDLPGIDTKFIERYANVLSQLFDVVSPRISDPHLHDDFRTRHGFLREPARIRFRILDPKILFAGLTGCPDIEMDEGSFSQLKLPILRVFATENKTNFLAFPRVDNAIIVFGSGYGMRALGRAEWMRSLPLYYWGDIDTHGFAILSEVREAFPNAKSFLMDEETLIDHRASWTTELSMTRGHVDYLSPPEKRLLQRLLPGEPWHGVRLEQEKIPLSDVLQALKFLLEAEQEFT